MKLPSSVRLLARAWTVDLGAGSHYPETQETILEAVQTPGMSMLIDSGVEEVRSSLGTRVGRGH